MHYSDQSDIVFIYFLSITFHHPNLNYSLGNDTADFHAFPKNFPRPEWTLTKEFHLVTIFFTESFLLRLSCLQDVY